MTQFCKTCKYFWVLSKTDTNHDGRCHRFPPVYAPSVTVPYKFEYECWYWPFVPANGSCGEHTPLPEKSSVL
jgi:hypothetical protein